MQGFTNFIEKRMSPVMTKIGGNKFLSIIRDSMSSIMALLIIGSIAILLGNIPYEPLANLLLPIAPLCEAIFMVTTGVMGLITAGTFAYYASIQYKTNTLPNVITSISVFLLTQYTAEAGLNIDGLGSMGLVSAMVVAYVTVKLDQLFMQKNIGIKMPASVPPAIANSFQSLLPATVSLIVFGVIAFVFGVDINEIVALLLTPLANVINTPWGYALYHMLCGLVFFCGINSAVVIGIVQPLILQNGAANDVAIAAGVTPEFPATVSTDTVIWGGGTGFTIGFVLLMLFFAKSKYFKTMGRLSFPSGIFNINEPVIFGTPIVFNPLFFIPFVVYPGIAAFLTYILMSGGLLAVPIISAIPWTLPPIVASFVMTAGNIPTTIWNLILVLGSVVAYYPFFRIADKQQYELELLDEQKEENK